LQIEALFNGKNLNISDSFKFEKIISLVKDRCTLLTDFYDQSWFFFKAPEKWDTDAVKPKWNEQKKEFFSQLIRNYQDTANWEAAILEAGFQTTAVANQLKPGEVQLPLRIMLVGGKFGPPVFNIAEVLGKDETISRIKKSAACF
jgi:glutamyl-tRNA synthetase